MITAKVLYLLLISQFHLTPTDAATFTCIAIAESSLKIDTINENRNGTIDYGLFQLNSVHLGTLADTPDELLDAHNNIKLAVKLYKRDGFKPWATYKKCGG